MMESIIISMIMSRRFSKAKEKNQRNPQNIFEITANVVDSNTLFMVFQLRIEIFQGITIKFISREFWN